MLGSGAYVFLPTKIRTDKFAPRSELMTYLGNAPGVKGWLFMHGPNNILFTAAQATFDETFFPRCPKAVRRPTTRLQTPAPPNQCSKDGTCHCSPPGNEEEDEERFETPPQFPPPSTKKGKGKADESEESSASSAEV